MRGVAKGFTIIEVVLVMAVTGLAIAGILVGSSSRIRQERYNDSAKQLQSSIQQMYVDVNSPYNERESSFACDSTGTVNQSPAVREPVGASECELLGRYLHIENGRKLIEGSVIGYPEDYGFNQPPDSDTELLRDYELVRSSHDQIERSVPWGGLVKIGTPPRNADVTIYTIRAPYSGGIATYVTTGPLVAGSIPDGVVATTAPRTILCMDAEDFSVSNKLSVVIGQNAASTNAISLGGDMESAAC